MKDKLDIHIADLTRGDIKFNRATFVVLLSQENFCENLRGEMCCCME